MRRFLKKCVLFTLFVIPAYIVLVIAWGEFFSYEVAQNVKYGLGSYGHTNLRLHNADDYSDIDILVMGSSHVYRGFDTRIFADSGYTAFNMGTSAQTPVQTEMLLKRYLPRMRPKLVILDVYPLALTWDGIGSGLDLLANDENDMNSLIMACRLKHIYISNTLIFALWRQALDLDADFKEAVNQDGDVYVEGGFVERAVGHYADTSRFTDTRLVYSDLQLNAYKRCVSYLKKQGVPYVLVQMPITNRYRSSFTNFDETDDFLRSLGTYYNFSVSMNLDAQKYFFDNNHLNQLGVDLIDRTLIQLLRKDNFLH